MITKQERPPVDRILAFYRLEAPDARGRMLHEIWQWDRHRLESVHDYIQWLFPLAAPSAFNPDAPLLTEGTMAAFRDDALLKQRLVRSLELMLAFYGLALQPGDRAAGVEPRIVESHEFARAGREWLRPGDHNHLRLTRILTSLRLLDLRSFSTALFDCLLGIHRAHPGAISEATVEYWRRATAGDA